MAETHQAGFLPLFLFTVFLFNSSLCNGSAHIYAVIFWKERKTDQYEFNLIFWPFFFCFFFFFLQKRHKTAFNSLIRHWILDSNAQGGNTASHPFGGFCLQKKHKSKQPPDRESHHEPWYQMWVQNTSNKPHKNTDVCLSVWPDAAWDQCWNWVNLISAIRFVHSYLVNLMLSERTNKTAGSCPDAS